MIDALKEREKIRGVLNKVISKEIAEEILKKNIELGGEERNATVLFCDIRGFTKLVENVQPKLLITNLNDFFTEICKIIDEQKGVVDKFVGDEVMALYGVPVPLDNDAKRAVISAVKMMQGLTTTNIHRASKKLPPLQVGIGIHSGLVVAGNVGSENRLSYTVLGANVNLAARLCGAAAPDQILITEATLKGLGEHSFKVQEVSHITLKGISNPVKLFEVQWK